VRPGDDLVAIEADGTVLVDAAGRRRRVRGDRVTFPASPEHGPYRLEAADRTLLAISA
jgi:hypothetical protein